MSAQFPPSSTSPQRSFPYSTSTSSLHPPKPDPPSLFPAQNDATTANSNNSDVYIARRSAGATTVNVPLLSTPHHNQYQPSPSTPSSASGASNSWDALRKQARKLETEVDARLLAFSRAGAQTHGSGHFGASGSTTGAGAGAGSGPSGATTRRGLAGGSAAVAADGGEAEVEELLRKLTQAVNEMAAYLDGPNPTNPSMMHMLQRHRDILYDYTREFKKTKANIQSSREHADLLSSVREDISSFRSGASSGQDMLLTERGRIDNSNRLADQILEQAYETKDSLKSQRGVLFGINRRVTLVASQIPGLNSIIGKIGTRKRRDSVILAGVISFCLFLLLMYIT